MAMPLERMWFPISDQ